MVNDVQDIFRKLFDSKPDVIVISPGRINLIGEHTDYNGGWVLPAAIDKKITFTLGKRTDLMCEFHSIDFNDTETIHLTQFKITDKSWVNYLLGVIEQFQNEKLLPHGFNLVFGGDVPLGAGLSSSAALEAGLAFAINEIYKLEKSRMELVKLAQRAENEFVGVRCGIMDMFASVMGKKDLVMRLDCRSLDFEYVPFHFPNIKIVLCDSGVKHSLDDGEYNIRRSQCEAGVVILKKYYPNISTLRDVTFSVLEKHKSEFLPIVFKRCRYVVKEIARVEAACLDLQNHDLISFGKKMYETHSGLSEDYGVSCEELDFLVNKCHTLDTCYGARMMGGGFGGCTINLIKTEAVTEFVDFMRHAYSKKYNLELKTYVVNISDGTQLVSNSQLV